MVLRCPGQGCGEPVTPQFAEILHRQAVLCPRCGTTIRFSAEAVREFRQALHAYRGLKDSLDRAQEVLIATAHADTGPASPG